MLRCLKLENVWLAGAVLKAKEQHREDMTMDLARLHEVCRQKYEYCVRGPRKIAAQVDAGNAAKQCIMYDKALHYRGP